MLLIAAIYGNLLTVELFEVSENPPMQHITQSAHDPKQHTNIKMRNTK